MGDHAFRNDRVLCLWSSLPPYMVAAFSALVHDGAAVTVVVREQDDLAPFNYGNLPFKVIQLWNARVVDVCAVIEAEAPTVLLCGGWNLPEFRRSLRLVEGVPRILAFDNQWRGSLRQRIGVLSSPWFLHRSFDAAFVPGDRQRVFAEKLGFPSELIREGLYAAPPNPRTFPSASERQGVLFVGRLVREKAIDALLSGYSLYCSKSSSPMPLTVAGKGPAESLIRKMPKVRYVGFLDRTEVQGVLAEHRWLVLPSRFEPWGVVVHEAALAGLPAIVSTACGSAPHLVRHGYNGLHVSPDPASVAKSLWRADLLPETQWNVWSLRSQQLAHQFTPQLWVQQLADLRSAVMRRRGL